ncbi:hypothetical protein U1Q18_013560 [Sarracenia purpurea var. burkii]
MKLIGDVGLNHVEFIPEIIPVLITLLKDGTPAVSRQVISCGIDLFRSTLIKVTIQGLYSSELDDSLASSWAWILKFKDEMYPIAFQPGSDGIRLPAVKFVKAVILLYTPDPSGSSEPPLHQTSEVIANKRPAFYGRILPVLLGLDPSSSANRGFRVSGAHYALKNAFLSCLKCTHPGAAPVWIFPVGC